MFTTKPGMFGLFGGFANPTGVALIIILTIMFICSLSFVRRGGYFQVFYFSHLNYWLYWGLLIIHAPNFWKWLIFFAFIFLVEKLYRIITSLLGHGKTIIDEGIPLPSDVTYLKIKKPSKFNFSPGDWCFIKIPIIAKFEWHPFTISSAPEDPEYFSVHVRGVGNWTNKLYEYFNDKTLREKKIDPYASDKMPKNLDVKSETILNYFNFYYFKIMVDGPFGSPSSNIYRSEHAVLICTGIGITPFASILQSIVYRLFLST